MSQWTHVNGSIRIDGLRMMGMPTPELGNRNLWDSEKETKWSFDVPGGSEGSLDYNFWVNPSASSMAAFTLNIFGDLRDFGADGIDSIIEYLNKVTESSMMIRSGIVEIKIEYGDTILMQYYTNSDGKGEWREVLRTPYKEE
jgi:hypothetical protein